MRGVDATKDRDCMSEKIYKKGSKVWVWCCTHDAQSMEKELVTLEYDHTEAELEKYAEEFMWNTKEPSWGFEEQEPEEDF